MRSGGLRSWLWWQLLPSHGWTSLHDCSACDGRGCLACGARRPPWWAFPLAWLYQLVDKLGTRPFVPMPTIVCDCDDCLGEPEERR